MVAGELEGDDKTNVEIRITEEQNELQEQIQKLKDDLINSKAWGGLFREQCN